MSAKVDTLTLQLFIAIVDDGSASAPR